MIQKFAGRALLAGLRPRFIVALQIEGTETPFQPEGARLSFATHRLALFAIDSITRVFADSDVIGKEYTLTVEQQIVDGKTTFWLGVHSGGAAPRALHHGR
jgi:hypothetical protein